MIEPYFIGLLEGDGSIQVNQWKKRTLQFRVVIKLKNTPANYHLCATIKEQTNLFNLHIRHGYVLLVQDHQQKLKQLLPILENYTFLSQKMQKDYAFFKYCLLSKPTISEYTFLKTNKHQVPGFHLEKRNAKDFLKYSWFPWWVVGFVEAEGCFCVRTNGKLSFSIGQKNDKELIEGIRLFFQMPNKIQSKANNMFVVEGAQRFMLANLIEFFENHQFLGQKKESFEKFKSVFFTPKSMSKDFGRCRG